MESREMTEMQRALEADGEKLRQLTGEDHGPFKLCDPIVGPRIQSLAILIAVEIAKQDNELDNLGDGESVVFMGKCPTINLVQLAEKINTHRDTELATLQSRIEALEAERDIIWPWERVL
jgi:hypothetical protein